jgi:hypothetical protein
MPPGNVPRSAERIAIIIKQGVEIQRAREAQGLTQRQAAEQIGTRIGTLKGWEQGRRGAPPSMLDRLVIEWGASSKILGMKAGICTHCGRPV